MRKEAIDYIMAVDFLRGQLEMLLDEYDIGDYNAIIQKRLNVVNKFENDLKKQLNK